MENLGELGWSGMRRGVGHCVRELVVETEDDVKRGEQRKKT